MQRQAVEMASGKVRGKARTSGKGVKLELGVRVSPAEVGVGNLRDRILATRPASTKVVTREIGVCSVL